MNQTISTNKKPLRVVLLYSAGHLGSAIILNALLKMPQIKIVGVVKTQPLQFNREGIKKLKKHMKKIGWRFGFLLFWQRCVQGLFFLINLLLPFFHKGIMPAWKIVKNHHINLHQSKNINDQHAAQFIEECAPDLIVSAFFNQILKPHILAIPSKGALNVHPGWLPAYKGAMAYFWVLKKGEEKSGVTVHWMDEGIDTGKIIARKDFILTKGMTQQNVLSISATIGAELLNDVFDKLYNNQPIETINLEKSNLSVYHSIPSSEEFNSYFSNNRFFRIRDTWKILIKNLHFHHHN